MEVTEYDNVPYRYMMWMRNDDKEKCGVMTTEHGLVTVRIWEMWMDGAVKQILYLGAIVDGRDYTRCERRPPSRYITPRGAAIIAGRWIKGLVEATE